jgi:hypothetical protein
MEKDLSILTESGSGSDNIKLNTKRRRIFQKYKVTNAEEAAELIEKLKQKIQAKAQKIRRYEIKNQYIQNKMYKDTNRFYSHPGTKAIDSYFYFAFVHSVALDMIYFSVILCLQHSL